MTDQKCAEFKEHISKIIKSKLVDYLTSCNYYSCLSDESTDPSVTEEEVIFIWFLNEGSPTRKYLCIGPVKFADAPGIEEHWRCLWTNWK